MQAVILIVLAILAGCHGYVYHIPANVRNPGTCFYNGRILPKGDNHIPMVCQKMNCREDGSIRVEGCERLEINTCTWIENQNRMKPYPECCTGTYECTDEDGNTSIERWLYGSEDRSNNAQKIPEKREDFKILSPFIIQLLLFV